MFTKGDWYYEEESGLILTHEEGEDTPTEIAEVLGDLANARLIAQSPRLYEALKEIVDAYEGIGTSAFMAKMGNSTASFREVLTEVEKK